MPQFDFYSFITQIFWVLFFFLLVYYFVLYFYLVKYSEVIKMRKLLMELHGLHISLSKPVSPYNLYLGLFFKPFNTTSKKI